MKNKFKNRCIIFRSLVYFFSFFIQSCTDYGEKHKVAAQERCDIAKTLSIKRYSSGDEDNIFSSGEFKQFREFRSSVQKDFKLITSTAFDHVTEHAFSDLLKEGAIFTAASSLGAVGLTVYGATRVVDFALSLPALKNQIENIIENYGDIPHETKIATGTKLACDFILGALLKSGKSVSQNDTLRMSAKDEIKRVANMAEFFKKTEFGRELKKISDRTNHIAFGSKVYKVKEKNNIGLSKGDYFYIDKKHKDHLEIFSEFKEFKCVVDLSGKVIEEKTKSGYGRKLNI